MNYTEEILHAILIALAVANFLLNTSRTLQAIELCRESLVLLSNKVLSVKKPLRQKFYGIICHTMFEAYRRASDHTNAIGYGRKLLSIHHEYGDEFQECKLSLVLAQICQSQSMHNEAKELYEKAITIMQKIGNRRVQAVAFLNLGNAFCSLGEYIKAKEYYEKALAISTEIGDRAGEGTWYGNLGNVFHSLGEYVKAKEYYEKALAISTEIGHHETQAVTYRLLASAFSDLREYRRSKSYCDKALAMSLKSGNKNIEASCHLTEGDFHRSLGDKHKAKACFEKALVIAVETGKRKVEARSYLNLGKVLQSAGGHDVAEECLEKALSIAENTGDAEIEFACCCNLTLSKLEQDNCKEAISLLFRSIEKSEKMRGFLQDSDQFKVSFADMHVFPYQQLSEYLCETGNPKDALNVAELGRARALADLMATRYSIETLISADPQSWTVVENVMNKESNCTCLYISYLDQTVFLRILKTSEVIQFRKLEVDKKTLHTRLAKVAENLPDLLLSWLKASETFVIYRWRSAKIDP